MMRTAHTLPLLGGLLLLAAGALLVGTAHDAGAQEVGGEDVDWTARAGEAWGTTCSGCHTVPDTAFESDRAFLRQIIETS